MKNLFLLSALVVGFGLITANKDCLHAATFTVTTTNISGPGSLPVAIAQANTTPGKNQIIFSVTNVITLGLPLPMVTNSLTITGSATVPTVISGGGILPLFTFAAGTTNSLSNLVLANGYTTNNGAAISNSSALSVTSCVITNNSATNRSGGAIFNSGVMTISSSVISDNQAATGGAVYNSGTMTLNNSMMSGNQAISSAGENWGGAIFNGGSLAISILTMSNNLVTGFDSFGGGIFNQGTTLSISQATFVSNTVACPTVGTAYGGALHSDSGTVKITNSTFFGNTAIGGNSDESSGFVVNGKGGSVSVQNGNCTLINCTVANNLAMGGAGVNINNQGQGIAGGIYNRSGTILLLNVIVAGNSASSNSPDLNGIFVSSGVNLIGNNQGATNLSIFDFQNVVANLGSLQNNGGPTYTCAPLSGSLAIGNGISTGAPTTDQRGVMRPQGGAFDIGAVEVVTGSPIIGGGVMVMGSGFNVNTIFDVTNSYRIQASTNLTTWINLITNGNGGALHFIDTAATNLNRRFYRTATP